MGICDSVTNPSFGRWACEAGGSRSSLSEAEEEGKVHAEIEKANGYKKCQDIMIIIKDFNAKIGDERIEDVVGPSGIDLLRSESPEHVWSEGKSDLSSDNQGDESLLWGVGSTVACESALRSAGTLLSRVRARYRRPGLTEGLKAMRSPCCGLAIYKKLKLSLCYE
ncbi:hypothetical protein PoB_002452000 [Plakobranchus ocellatus]|uniref:Uncharacterized protein n=1 Tax=Plakobranchus ocellatus TaxID=259542 RepID=A0AAV3ZQL3_9GAST|nr:hypothetical protein PoB_002452000 [Plakobranchus ocellatus]